MHLGLYRLICSIKIQAVILCVEFKAEPMDRYPLVKYDFEYWGTEYLLLLCSDSKKQTQLPNFQKQFIYQNKKNIIIIG